MLADRGLLKGKRIAIVAPDAVLTPGPGGSFPLAVEEMRWQLDFLSRMGA